MRCMAYRTRRSVDCSRSCAQRRKVRPLASPRLGGSERFRRSSPWVLDPRLFKSFAPQYARIALAARSSAGTGIVTTVRQAEVHAQLASQFHDLSFREADQRGVNLEVCSTLDTRFGGEIRHALIGLNELGTAIGIARVIECINADENVR